MHIMGQRYTLLLHRYGREIKIVISSLKKDNVKANSSNKYILPEEKTSNSAFNVNVYVCVIWGHVDN